jgi:hypothetical protein
MIRVLIHTDVPIDSLVVSSQLKHEEQHCTLRNQLFNLEHLLQDRLIGMTTNHEVAVRFPEFSPIFNFFTKLQDVSNCRYSSKSHEVR